MIPDLSLPEYYITSVDIDATPTVGKTVIGSVGSEFDIENPTYTSDPEGFQCSASLKLDLYVDGKAPWQVEDPTKFGEIEVDLLIHIPDEREKIESHVEDWSDDSPYEEVNEELRHHIESGILQYIIDPIGDLLSNSYNGIIPRMRFVHSSADSEKRTDG
ncbi:hypothetical protein ACOZ4I_20290 (plasmid) [Haloarcula salina]|uniref:hypothetical protein n=1 Tax=Haloarcula salina TaxID=1429914 RepID=UPI003C6F22BD